jgi:hypothetical protein
VAIALLVLVGGAITSGMAIAAATKSNSFPPLSAWTVLLLPLGSCLLGALILFAWAQILDYLARTAFHAERAANALSHEPFV